MPSKPVHVSIEVGVRLDFDASTYRQRDATYAQIRSAFQKIAPYVESKYGVSMEHEVEKVTVTDGAR